MPSSAKFRPMLASPADLVKDEIKERIRAVTTDDIEDRIASVLRNGSFSVQFSRF